jgi:hypothetical protein
VDLKIKTTVQQTSNSLLLLQKLGWKGSPLRKREIATVNTKLYFPTTIKVSDFQRYAIFFWLRYNLRRHDYVRAALVFGTHLQPHNSTQTRETFIKLVNRPSMFPLPVAKMTNTKHVNHLKTETKVDVYKNPKTYANNDFFTNELLNCQLSYSLNLQKLLITIRVKIPYYNYK